MKKVFWHNSGILFPSLIILANFLIKIIPAALTGLGNDEVYYLTYARYPAWSHFDHPPMVGLLIQLFTLDLKFTGELAIRSGSLVVSSLAMMFLYLLVRKVYSERAAVYSLILFAGSFYFNIISGLFIMPDTPQVFFISVALYFLFPSLINPVPGKKDGLAIILFGFFTGLAFLSKYHSLFLWVGAGLYILLHNRVWLKKASLYVSGIITLALMLPVLYWNSENDFISFTFHGGRVGPGDMGINLLSFMQFTIGQILYQNPVIAVVCVYFVIVFLRKASKRDNTAMALLYLSVPLIAFFTLSSLFKTSLPHWTGPAFLPLIILSSGIMDKISGKSNRTVTGVLVGSASLMVAVLIAGTLQINMGIFSNGDDLEPHSKGKNDFTLDMYGWKQSGKKFASFLEKANSENVPDDSIVIISDRWFPGAHIDHYIAIPNGLKMFVAGDISRSHKYFSINSIRGYKTARKLYFITDSRNYFDPANLQGDYKEIVPADTIEITRNSVVVKYLFIFEIIPEGNFFR